MSDDEASPNPDLVNSTSNANKEGGEANAITIEARMRAWFVKVEAALITAARIGVATEKRKSERAKGSDPRAKPEASTAAHRPPRPVANRILGRLQRAVTCEWQHGKRCHDVPSEPLRRAWFEAQASGIISNDDGEPTDFGRVMTIVDKTVTAAAEVENKAVLTDWKKKFRQYNLEALRAGASMLRTPAPALTFSSGDMRKEWTTYWTPEGGAKRLGGSWAAEASAQGLHKIPQRPWVPPTYEAFLKRALAAKGSAGFDGIEADELAVIATACPALIQEIYDILVEATWATADPQKAGQLSWVIHTLYHLRVVGIPKRGSDDSRPISVMSLLARTWHSCLFSDLPLPEAEQYSERGVVRSVASWLAAPGRAGAEIDLSKAYDSIDHEAAAQALRHLGTPEPVVCLLEQAWRAPRTCCVEGDLAESILPVAGIPAGDPASTRVLGALIAPWHAAMRKVPSIKPWAYVDDRSLKAGGSADIDTQSGGLSPPDAASTRMADVTERHTELSDNDSLPELIDIDTDDESLADMGPGSEAATTVPASDDELSEADSELEPGKPGDLGFDVRVPDSAFERPPPVANDDALMHDSVDREVSPNIVYTSPGTTTSVLDTAHDDLRAVHEALELTKIIDGRIGVAENTKKRQVWSQEMVVEHLGIKAAAGAWFPQLPPPRDGWEAISALTHKLKYIPGPANGRMGIGVTCVASKYRWALPFLQPPPWELVRETFLATQRTTCGWWSQPRVWAQSVSAHPVYGTAIQAIKMAGTLLQWKSTMLTLAIETHAEVLQLCPVECDGPREGIWLTTIQDPIADPRVKAAIDKVRPPGTPGFRADNEAGQHTLRVIARALILKKAPGRGRQDEEGIELIDIEACSSPPWKKWKKSLNCEQTRLLGIWRGGAILTPTRRFRGRDVRAHCPWCSQTKASARHFWVECPRFQAKREKLQVEYSINPDWWALQPRVTSKTGWITITASDNANRRAQLQIAACRLGISVCFTAAEAVTKLLKLE